jgi:hypothetical protein
MKVINKFIILEIKETNYFNQFDVDYSINLQTSKGFKRSAPLSPP